MIDDSIIISNRIRLARNIEKYPFPSLLDKEKSVAIKNMVTDSILNSNSYIAKEFELLDLKKMKNYERLALVEKHLISKEGLELENFCVLVNKNENISIMVNEEDHIRLQVINKGSDIKKSYDLANKIDDLMAESLNYAFNSKLGYLTSCLTNIGCGIRASFMLHLPILNRKDMIKVLADSLSKEGITIRGIYGEGSEGVGNIFQISNSLLLGFSEEEIIETLLSKVSYIIDNELKERERLLANNKEEFQDLMLRSLGILKYGKIISSLEAFNLLSNVRCGKEMGIIDTIDIEEIQKTLENIQTGNIQRILSRNLTPRERDIERAKMLNKIFN